MELGYTDRTDHAAVGEPEAVDVATQAALTRASNLAHADRRREQFRERRAAIEAELDALVQERIVGRHDLRMIRRELDRLARTVA